MGGKALEESSFYSVDSFTFPQYVRLSKHEGQKKKDIGPEPTHDVEMKCRGLSWGAQKHRLAGNKDTDSDVKLPSPLRVH